MIRLIKNFTNVPKTLTGTVTEKHRKMCIDQGKWVQSDRYKQKDITDILKDISHSKCSYCERSVLDMTWPVEHYRPKSTYYWLAHSWDNLLCCCEWCNIYKSAHFEIAGTQASFDPARISDIHTLDSEYDLLEKPLMVNPEKEDIESTLIFDKSGAISSDDPRVSHTIEVCRINRPESNMLRKKVLDDLSKRVLFWCRMGKKAEIPTLIKEFEEESHNANNEFLAFRRYILRNGRSMIQIS